eukprot:COSAG02_NODE_2951_length_7674_cov_3.531881_6_plen_95_part_00
MHVEDFQISQCNSSIDFSRSEYAVLREILDAATQQLEVRNEGIRSISSSRKVRNACPPPLIDVSDPDSDQREDIIGAGLAAAEEIRGAGETADV